jgi:hypothetical protein
MNYLKKLERDLNELFKQIKPTFNMEEYINRQYFEWLNRYKNDSKLLLDRIFMYDDIKTWASNEHTGYGDDEWDERYIDDIYNIEGQDIWNECICIVPNKLFKFYPDECNNIIQNFVINNSDDLKLDRPIPITHNDKINYLIKEIPNISIKHTIIHLKKLFKNDTKMFDIKNDKDITKLLVFCDYLQENHNENELGETFRKKLLLDQSTIVT